jgi:hypothetical protein
VSLVFLIAGWLGLNAAVALGVAIISHRRGTFAEKPRRVAVSKECPERDTHPTLP